MKTTITTFGLLAGLVISGSAFAQSDVVSFKLVPNPKFEACLGVPGGPAPTATATVVRGKLNDTLHLRVSNLRPDLAFDLFTVQRTSLLASGAPDPSFNGDFGLAWYQSDVEADKKGDAEVTIKTILLDQIFGFDPLVNLAPTNTFHLGFWFNNPTDAAACGFDVTKPTPFNGEHQAGPLAMISLPNAETGVGPLCTKPGPNGGACNP
jgi:hypothetical protein